MSWKNLFAGAWLFFFSFSCFADGEEDFSPARRNLEKLLQNYNSPSLIIPLRQEIFLSILKTNLMSEGHLFLKRQKFRLELKGNPSSLSIFDGDFLWHQPDLKEKLVFRIKKQSEIQRLSSFFESQALFESFKLKDFVQRKPLSFYHFQPVQKIQGLKEVFMKTDQKRILEMRFTWEDLNTWQKYTFSKPIVKSNPATLFKWNQTGYRILEKEDF